MPQQISYKVLLIGDSCEDEYIYGSCERLNPEAPVPILNFKRKEIKSGMAANVYLNLQSFKMEISFLTNKEKITKKRYIDEKSNQQLLRVDNDVNIVPLSDIELNDDYHAVIISDYNKGYLTKEKLFEVVSRFSCPIFIDSKKTILPNKENCFIKINDLEYKNLDQEYLQKNLYDNLIITKGGDGCIYNNKLYKAEKVNVYDVVGAGDTFLAALVYGYLNYKDIGQAIILANRAAAIAVQNPGTYVLKEKDVNLLCGY
jgi:D-beta-D-heptose 7-phosphate kinase/D-beta-D-heptose 1-phosphate adenosyltransferase